MNWRFWTWGDNRKAPLQLEAYQPTSALRAPSTTQHTEPVHHPIPRVQSVATIRDAVDDDEPETDEDEENVDDDEEEEEEETVEDNLPFPKFTVPVKNVTVPGTEANTALAMSIGCATPEQVYPKLVNYFNQEQIGVAESKDVIDWLTENMYFDDSSGWYWRPLRSFDRMNEQEWGNDDYDSNDWSSRLYDEPVPTRVLERVAKIIAAFGNNVRFYISDFPRCDYDCAEHCKGSDIFIMVFPASFTPNGEDKEEDFFYVFDTWAKPSYEDPPKPLIANLPV
ncbi:MAG: hypothetical protein NTX72_03260 [Candidatus Uhrbacteria bacterium]|nr:hypothetical protein [Candidatus Uhrbacteria bacterium]